MELKLAFAGKAAVFHLRFNRTFMELKQVTMRVRDIDFVML